jgi:hypothetical protein
VSDKEADANGNNCPVYADSSEKSKARASVEHVFDAQT